jgi:hypothetical protein
MRQEDIDLPSQLWIEELRDHAYSVFVQDPDAQRRKNARVAEDLSICEIARVVPPGCGTLNKRPAEPASEANFC